MEEMVQQSIVAGGSVALFFLLIALIPTILCIVLFFKIWIMTNDVSKIKDLLQERTGLEHSYVKKAEEQSVEEKTS